jgi:hypothetical protein
MTAASTPVYCIDCGVSGTHRLCASCFSKTSIPCCTHCGCGEDGRIGHDDTCRFGCNDATAKEGS